MLTNQTSNTSSLAELLKDENQLIQVVRESLDTGAYSRIDELTKEAYSTLDDDRFMNFIFQLETEASCIRSKDGSVYYLDVFGGIVEGEALAENIAPPNLTFEGAVMGKEWFNIESFIKLSAPKIREIFVKVLNGEQAGLPPSKGRSSPFVGCFIIRKTTDEDQKTSEVNMQKHKFLWDSFREQYLHSEGVNNGIVELTPPVEIALAKSGALEEIAIDELSAINEQISNLSRIVQKYPDHRFDVQPTTNSAGVQYSKIIISDKQGKMIADSYILMLVCQTQKVLGSLMLKQMENEYSGKGEKQTVWDESPSNLGFGILPGVFH